MNYDIIKDFLKIFFSSNSHYSYDKSYSVKAEKHAMNRLSIDEMTKVKHYFFKNNVPENIKILDVGCNTGLPLINIMKETRNSIGHGIDINKHAIDNNKGVDSNVTFQLYDGYTIPFEDNFFDYVMLHHVLGHVTDPNRILLEINRVLKPGGTLSIITPNLFYKLFKFPKNLFNNFKPDSSILRYYTKIKLKNALKANNFTNNLFYYFGDYSFLKVNISKIRICSISKKSS
jgi:ubiquinone/menaquinone biosynthesis C-methylase UbiE